MIKISDIVEAMGGVLKNGCGVVEAAAVSIDSRTIMAGEVFFALRGPNFDGHDFLGRVAARRASCVVIERGQEKKVSGAPCIVVVEDTLKALGDLASFLRRRTSIPLIAVGGSTGKTTTKEMIAAILARSRHILKTEGNRNNLVGLPLTLLGLDASHMAAVVELGISGHGEMERLVEISDPNVALITNMGRAHLKDLGDMDGVAGAKGELFRRPAYECVRVVNLDDELSVKATSALLDRAVTFSLHKEADVRVLDYKEEEDLGGANVRFSVRGEVCDVRLNVPGAFNVINAAAAIAAVLPLDVYLDDICEGLAAFAGVKGRLEIVTAGSITLLDDTYNSNPESMAAALGALGRAKGRKVAVIGEMHELGDHTAQAHREAGMLAAELGVDILVAVGRWSDLIIEGALGAGLKQSRAFSFEDNEGAVAALKRSLLKEGDFVLVKGSRAAGLEEVVQELKRPDKGLNQARG